MERKTIFHFIYGRPCSGKTEAMQHLANKSDVTYISVGNITRNEINSGSALGLQLKSYLEAIKEYPPELITQTLRTHILTTNTSIAVLDGYPKYGREAHSFEKLAREHRLKLGSVAIISITLDEAVKRAESRRICPHCQKTFSMHESKSLSCPTCPNCLIKLTQREDDSPEVLSRRFHDFDDYMSQTLPILRNLVSDVVEIDGLQSQDKIADQLSTIFRFNSNKPG